MISKSRTHFTESVTPWSLPRMKPSTLHAYRVSIPLIYSSYPEVQLDYSYSSCLFQYQEWSLIMALGHNSYLFSNSQPRIEPTYNVVHPLFSKKILFLNNTTKHNSSVVIAITFQTTWSKLSHKLKTTWARLNLKTAFHNRLSLNKRSRNIMR